MTPISNARAKNGAGLTIQDLYPELTPEQQETAQENLDRYVALTWRIFLRFEAERQAALTEPQAVPTMDSQRSSDTNNKFISE